MAIKKAEYEKLLVENIKNIGLARYCSMHGEGRKRNNEYYQFILEDGSEKYLINPSEYFKDALGIE